MWNWNDARENEGHYARIFSIAASSGFKSGSDSSAFVSFALGECFVFTNVAFQAGDVMVESNPFAHAEFFYARAHLNDYPGGFVAKNSRRRNSAVLNFLYIRWANPTNGYLHQEFVRFYSWDGNGFDAKVVFTSVNQSAHCFRNQHAKKLHKDKKAESGKRVT
jgi:hypothetical protein